MPKINDWKKKYRNAWYNKEKMLSVIIRKIKKPKHYIIQLNDEKKRKVLDTKIEVTLDSAYSTAKRLMKK